MIRLKKLLEQLGGKNAVFKQSPIDKSIVITPFDAKKVAKLLYNSKGYINDDESLAKDSIIKNINNIEQYKQVNKELQSLTSGRGIGAYLRSFLNNVDRFKIVRSLVYKLPKTDWKWTIAKIMPFSDFKLLVSKNPSYWNVIVGNSMSNQPVTNAELQLIQFYEPEKIKDSNYGFWDRVIDTFLSVSGTPIKDARDLLSDFDAIIKRRIDYNKKHNLPIDTLTPEEKTFREKILKATPNYGYPNIFGLSKIIQDINQGKNIQPQEFERYKKIGTYDYGNIGKQKYSDQKLKTLLGSREELKRMWLGIDEPDGESKGFWVKSEFKPKDSTNPNAVYYKPKDIPKLTPQQFDELYNAIMDTKKPDGKFPGGNSSILFDNKFKFINASIKEKIRGDLGHFKFGAGKENGKTYISIYDEWDLMPPSAKKFGVNVQKYGKTPLIYYRIFK